MLVERMLVVESPGVVAVHREPLSSGPADGQFEAHTLYSGLSAGTELSFIRGTNPYLTGCWNAELGLFQPGQPGLCYPVTQLGYMEVAQVGHSRTPVVPSGALVAMAYGHRSRYLGDPLVDRVVPLPDDLDPLLGIYVAHMGPICANGLLHAAAELHDAGVRTLADGVLGRRVAVIGAGVVGLLTAAFARRHGATSVVVIDPTAQRRAAAVALGFETVDPDAADPAPILKARWRHGVADRGADVVFQCRGRCDSLALALRLLRPQGTVVDLAFYQAGAGELRLGEEFHHNGLALRCAQIGRVPRGLAHYWDRDRLSAETLDLLRAEGPAIRKHLVTDVLPLTEAPALLADLNARRRHVLQAVFTFGNP
ncbi:MAG: zinc-dependent alcohol dehydrogenase [Pseudonocardiaceae bacterium]